MTAVTGVPFERIYYFWRHSLYVFLQMSLVSRSAECRSDVAPNGIRTHDWPPRIPVRCSMKPSREQVSCLRFFFWALFVTGYFTTAKITFTSRLVNLVPRPLCALIAHAQSARAFQDLKYESFRHQWIPLNSVSEVSMRKQGQRRLQARKVTASACVNISKMHAFPLF